MELLWRAWTVPLYQYAESELASMMVCSCSTEKTAPYQHFLRSSTKTAAVWDLMVWQSAVQMGWPHDVLSRSACRSVPVIGEQELAADQPRWP